MPRHFISARRRRTRSLDHLHFLRKLEAKLLHAYRDWYPPCTVPRVCKAVSYKMGCATAKRFRSRSAHPRVRTHHCVCRILSSEDEEISVEKLPHLARQQRTDLEAPNTEACYQAVPFHHCRQCQPCHGHMCPPEEIESCWTWL
jgi:hypothetical protein